MPSPTQERSLESLPRAARHLFDNVLSTAKNGLVEHDEATAGRIAWAAVERFYERSEDGTWRHR